VPRTRPPQSARVPSEAMHDRYLRPVSEAKKAAAFLRILPLLAECSAAAVNLRPAGVVYSPPPLPLAVGALPGMVVGGTSAPSNSATRPGWWRR